MNNATDEPVWIPYTVLSEYKEFGKSRIKIQCPWCHEEFWAYVWSLAGSGKKCTRCGSKHGMYTGAQKPKDLK